MTSFSSFSRKKRLCLPFSQGLGGMVRGVRKLTGDNLKVVWAEFSLFKLDCFASLQNKCITNFQNLLELKTQPRFRPVNWSLSMDAWMVLWKRNSLKQCLSFSGRIKQLIEDGLLLPQSIRFLALDEADRWGVARVITFRDENVSRALYYKTLEIFNLQEVDKFCIKLASFLL